MNVEKILCLNDLMEYVGADEPHRLNAAVYKTTECGAFIRVRTPEGLWLECGEDWSGLTAVDAFQIGTIVEGVDSEVVSKVFVLPVEAEEVDAWVLVMEEAADQLWVDNNEGDDQDSYSLRIDEDLDDIDREQLGLVVEGCRAACSNADEDGWTLHPGEGQSPEEFANEMQYLEGFNRPRGWLLEGHVYDEKTGEVRKDTKGE